MIGSKLIVNVQNIITFSLTRHLVAIYLLNKLFKSCWNFCFQPLNINLLPISNANLLIACKASLLQNKRFLQTPPMHSGKWVAPPIPNVCLLLCCKAWDVKHFVMQKINFWNSWHCLSMFRRRQWKWRLCILVDCR